MLPSVRLIQVPSTLERWALEGRENGAEAEQGTVLSENPTLVRTQLDAILKF